MQLLLNLSIGFVSVRPLGKAGQKRMNARTSLLIAEKSRGSAVFLHPDYRIECVSISEKEEGVLLQKDLFPTLFFWHFLEGLFGRD